MLLYHRDLGGAGRPPLVILHGFLGASRNWQTAGAALAARFHVRALDLRNHGRSPHAPEMTYPALVADVLAWLDAQPLARVTLLGHSLGGKVAMALACRHPERVARLIVVDIAPKEYPALAQRTEVAAMNELRLGELHSRAEAELRMEARVPDFAMRRFLASNLERAAAGPWRWTINLPVLTAALPELVKSPLRPEEQFAGPAQFILCGRSNFVRPDDHDLIRRHFPRAGLRLLADSGHNPHLEARDAFVALVTRDA